MKLKQIEFEGFRGVRSSLTVPFGEDFTVITGPNGSGKSSIIDAIEFALLGRLTKFGEDTTEKGERGEKGSDYVWWRGAPAAKRHVVRIELTEEGSRPLIFSTGPETATSRPDIRWFCAPSQSPEDPLEQICRTSIFRDELIAALSTDMSEMQRGELVNKAIGLTSLVAVERRCSDYVGALREKREGLQKSYDSLRSRIADLTSEASELRATAHVVAEGEGALNQAINRPYTRELVSTLRSRLTGLRRDSENLERLKARWSETRNLHAKLQLLNSQFFNLAEQQKELEARVSELEASFAAVDSDLRKSMNLTPLAASLALLRQHGKQVGLREGHCPLCNSAVAPEAFEEHLAELELEISSMNQRVTHLTAQQASAAGRLQEIRNRSVQVRSERDRTAAEIKSIENSISEVKEQLKRYGVEAEDMSINGRLNQMKAELSEFEAEFAAAEVSLTLERVTEIERTREAADTECVEVEQRLQTIQRAMATANKTSAAVKRVSRELLEERIAALSPVLSELYFRLRPHIDYTDVKYRMRGDVRRLLRLEVGNELNPRFMFSSGQRRALGLAFLFAVHLSRPWCRFQTLILDDVVQHVDDYRALHLVEVLSSIRQKGHQVICTVEDTALADLLCRRLRATDAGKGVMIRMKYEAGAGVSVASVEKFGPFPKSILLSA